MTDAAVADLPADSQPSTSAGTLRRWCSSLFTAAPERDRLTWVAWVLAAVAVVVSLTRQVGVPAWDTIWAEDGLATLHGAVNDTFLHALATPVSGYYQTMPRLLAEPVALLPAAWAAKAFALEAAAVNALFALVVYAASGAYLRVPLARLVAAAVAMFIPVAITDVPNSLCNLHWAGMYAVFWVLLWVPSGRVGQAASIAVVVLVAITNIMVLAFLPLALFRGLFGPRGWYSRVLPAALALGFLPQVIAILNGSTAAREQHPALLTPVKYYLTTALPSGLIGGDASLALRDTIGSKLVAAALVWLAVLGVVLVAAARLTRPDWRIAAVLGLHSFAFWMLAAGSTGQLVSRYMTTTGMFAVAALVALVLPRDGRRAGVPLIVLAVAFGAVWAGHLWQPTGRGDGPSWVDGVEQARQQCADPAVHSAPVPISPLMDPPWAVSLPCTYLLR